MLVSALIETRRQYQWVFSIYVPIALGVFAAIVLIVAFAILRYRRRPATEAARWHKNDPLEGTYAVLLACVVAFLLYVTYTAEHRVDTVANRERPSLIIDVTGAKWEWTFYYPAYGITQLSGAVGRQPLVVPADEAIRFNLRTLDVIHAFWVPEARYKHDLMPGSTQVSTLTFGRTGLYQGECAEFCGLRHSEMVFNVRVLGPSAFRVWAASGGAKTAV